eukprot:7697243-Pyramimonas_sp.AAC.1
MVNNLYAASIFLSSNGHWNRIVKTVSQAVEQHLVISYDPRPRGGADQYGWEMLEFVIRNRRTARQYTDEGEDGELS